MKPSPKEIYDHMFSRDGLSSWLGIEHVESSEQYCKIKMVVRKEMLNGFGITHGGILFSLADSALAFACNTDNNLTVSINGTIHYQSQTTIGDVLFAEAKLESQGNKISLYRIKVYTETQICAIMQGTVYHTTQSLIDK